MLGGLPPSVVQGDVEAARQAGHLYLAAYIPGVICLAATAVGVYRLALLSLPLSKRNASARSAYCWLLGAVAGANLGLVWGAMSGLEIALSTAIIVWATVQLIVDVRRGALRWSLLLVALVPLVRPDLLAMSGAAFVWLLWRALRGPYPEGGRTAAFRNAATYLLAMVAGTGLMALIYYVGWGRPFSSSFYAKVRGLRLGDKFWFASDRLRADRGNGPVVAAGLAAAGGLVQWLAPPRREDNRSTDGRA